MSISNFLRRTLALIVVSIIGLSIPAIGQSFYGSIVGTVTDPSGAALPGADITLTDVQTGVQSHAKTGGAGEYQFFNLTPAQYKVDITASGFKRYSRTGVTVVVDQATRIDASMPVGATNQEVIVTAQSPILQSENASVGTTISGAAVDNLPLNGRNVLNLAALSPAIVPQGGTAGPLTGQNVFAAGNYQIGGGNGNQGSTLIDGAPVNLNYANQTSMVPTQDSVQEFRVETNNLTAEYGMFTGGVINITTKSGTNAFHGTLYEYFRNTHLNANPYAFAPGAGKQPFHQNQFGGSIGGPIKKDKLFFFGNYEGYRNHQGRLYTETEPTAAELSGDFSNYRNAAGQVIPIYDPNSTCGYNGNAACTAAQLAGTAPTRAQFPGNKIPMSAMDPVALKMIAFPYFAPPTGPGQAYTQLNNFSKFAVTGGHYDQYDARVDYAMSQKQHIFARYMRWNSLNQGANPYGNGMITGDPISPEGFKNNQTVIGDTYLFSPKTIFDIRVSYLRWTYQRTPGYLGLDPAAAFGFPSYLSAANLKSLQGFSPATTPPNLSFSNPTYNVGGTGLIVSTNNNVILAPTFTRVVGRHTLKFGADLRSLNWEFFQSNNPGGIYYFSNTFTSQNALNPGGTGGSLASFLLGDLGDQNTSSLQISPVVTQITRYQGYYANDTWQATDKLTLTLGLRYEVPGVFYEKHNNFSYFNANSINPVFAGLNVNGGPVMGSYGLVATPQHPQRGARIEHFTDFSPRFGIAYRLTETTVLRTGFGVFFLPSDLLENEGPNGSAVNYLTNPVVNTTNTSQTPANRLSNPFPGGPLGAPQRSANFQNVLLGGTGTALQPNEPNAYAQQFNVGVQHQFSDGVALDVAYGGLHSQHLPRLVNINTLPDKYLSLGNALLAPVANPFYPTIKQGVLTAATVPYEYTLLPYPAYGNIQDPGQYQGVSNYSSLQVKLEKRFRAGGNVLGAYTFSKLLTDTENWTAGWLDSATGSAGYQDYNNLQAEYANSSFDNRQRLTAGYVYPLPFGRGQQYFSGVGRVASEFVSGWAVNGLTTFQLGYPLGFTATPNLTHSLGGGLRPNLVPGCNPKQGFGGAVTSHLLEAFNTSCFTVPAPFTYGNAPRTLPYGLRGHGIDNWDFALAKTTQIKESVAIEMRVEAYNLFNRVQFGNPGLVVTTAPNTLYGQITTQINTPRILQLGARLKF